jgi:hypothetical protein
MIRPVAAAVQHVIAPALLGPVTLREQLAHFGGSLAAL